MPRLLLLGDWGVRLSTYTAYAESQVRRLYNLFPLFFNNAAESYKESRYLVIASPSVLNDQGYPIGLLERDRPTWKHFHKAWVLAYQQFSCVRPLTSSWNQDPTRRFTFSWPELNHDIMRDSDSSRNNEWHTQFFCLVLDEPDERSPTAIFIYSLFLATWWHVMRGGLCLHSAAVERGHDGFLFLGDSEAGKTTVAQLSATVGNRVLADELNFVIRSEKNSYKLAAAPNLQPSAVVGNTLFRPPLRGLFSLVKDERNNIITLSPMVMARALFYGFLQTPVGLKLPGAVTRLAFKAACEIARSVPGYELHFRKSPDFWDVIDAELGN